MLWVENALPDGEDVFFNNRNRNRDKNRNQIQELLNRIDATINKTNYTL